MQVKVKFLYPNSKMPTQGSVDAAGFDLYARLYEPIIIPAHEQEKISVGIAAEIPQGYYAQIRGRSGLASRGIVAFDGTIDSDYRGEWFVTLFNHTKFTYVIHHGNRIAQAVFMRHSHTELIEAETLDETERGEHGYGSTGR